MLRIVKRVLAGAAAIIAALVAFAFLMLQQTLPPKPALSGSVESGALDVGGLHREWMAYVPRRLAHPTALVVVLHGSMGSGQRVRVEDFGYDFDRIADQHGLVVVYPQGFEGHWNNAARAGPYSAKERQVDDVAFLHAMVTRLAGTYGVDRTRVFVVGSSNGGSMVERLALETPAFARAYAVVCESLPVPGNLAVTPAGQPVSILYLNGTADPIIPWRGGDVALWPVLASRGHVRSVADSVAYFRALAGIQSGPEVVQFPDRDDSDGSTVTRATWTGPRQHRIVQITVVGGGHGAPHPQKRGMRLLGRSNRDFHAAEAIWEFFAATLADSPPARPVHSPTPGRQGV